MEDVIHYTGLYDLYRDLLSQRQREVFEDYFFENFTLEEIALFDGVSKSFIAKLLKQAKEDLDEFERKLQFKKYMDEVKKEFKDETEILNRIIKYDNIVL